MSNTLTLVSGKFLRTDNNTPNITSGMITAGWVSHRPELDHYATQLRGPDRPDRDNGGGVVTLVKSGHWPVDSRNNDSNNAYTGGTYVLEGTLTTGTTDDRPVSGLGSGHRGQCRADDRQHRGRQRTATGADYTALNGAPNRDRHEPLAPIPPGDTFDIGTGSVLSGNSASGQGLASLDRGIGGGTANITLA